MKTHDAELQVIKDLLRENPKGMKVTQIARELAMNRNACAKFLEILLMTGQVEQIENGMSKIFFLSQRISIPTMLDRSDDFILVLDREMKISQVNDNYLKFSGLKREDLLGKTPENSGFPVIGRQPFFDKIREAHYGLDIRTECQDFFSDREFFFEVRMTPTVFNDGTRGVTIIIEDITREKKRMASVTDESRQLVEGILSCIDDAVILLDFRTGAVSFANPAAIQLFGYAQEEFMGKNPGLLIGAEGKIHGYPVNVHESFTKQGFYDTQSRLKRNGSGDFAADVSFRPIYDTRGEVKNIIMIIRDMTGRPQTPQKLIQHEARDPSIPLIPRIFPAGSDRCNPAS